MKKMLAVVLAVILCLPSISVAASCEEVVAELNRKLPKKVNEPELVEVLRSLKATNGKKLPPRYVNKARAYQAGWKPSRDLWQIGGMEGKTLGGDRYLNHSGKLPNISSTWREADLDYKGGRRGSKRLLYGKDAPAYITVDHYETFTEIPACQ